MTFIPGNSDVVSISSGGALIFLQRVFIAFADTILYIIGSSPKRFETPTRSPGPAAQLLTQETTPPHLDIENVFNSSMLLDDEADPLWGAL